MLPQILSKWYSGGIHTEFVNSEQILCGICLEKYITSVDVMPFGIRLESAQNSQIPCGIRMDSGWTRWGSVKYSSRLTLSSTNWSEYLDACEILDHS